MCQPIKPALCSVQLYRNTFVRCISTAGCSKHPDVDSIQSREDAQRFAASAERPCKTNRSPKIFFKSSIQHWSGCFAAYKPPCIVIRDTWRLTSRRPESWPKSDGLLHQGHDAGARITNINPGWEGVTANGLFERTWRGLNANWAPSVIWFVGGETAAQITGHSNSFLDFACLILVAIKT